MLFVTLRAGKNFDTDELPIGVIVGSSFGCGIGVALLWLWPLGPIAKKRVAAGQVVLAPGVSTKAPGNDTDTDLASGHVAANLEEGLDDKDATKAEDKGNNEEQEETDVPSPGTTKEVVIENEVASEEVKAEARPKFTSSLRKLSQSFADSTYNQDLQSQSMAENAGAKEIWDNAELYDEDAEMIFTYLQVFTACLNSFAHGGESEIKSTVHISTRSLLTTFISICSQRCCQCYWSSQRYLEHLSEWRG